MPYLTVTAGGGNRSDGPETQLTHAKSSYGGLLTSCVV